MRLKRLRSGVWQVLTPCSDRGDCELLDFLSELEGGLRNDAKRLAGMLTEVASIGPSRKELRLSS